MDNILLTRAVALCGCLVDGGRWVACRRCYGLAIAATGGGSRQGRPRCHGHNTGVVVQGPRRPGL